MSQWYSRPVFHVRDTPRALAFYEQRLGFTEAWRYEEDGRLRIAQVARNDCEIILTDQWPDQAGHGVLFISLDRSVFNAAREEFSIRGADVRSGRWGYDLVVVRDEDGNQLWFPSPDH